MLSPHTAQDDLPWTANLAAIGDALAEKLQATQPQHLGKVREYILALQAACCDDAATIAALTNEQLREIGVEVGHRSLIVHAAKAVLRSNLQLEQQQSNSENTATSHLSPHHPLPAPASVTTMFLSLPQNNVANEPPNDPDDIRTMVSEEDDDDATSRHISPSPHQRKHTSANVANGLRCSPQTSLVSPRSLSGAGPSLRSGGHPTASPLLKKQPSWSSMSAELSRKPSRQSLGMPVFAAAQLDLGTTPASPSQHNEEVPVLDAFVDHETAIVSHINNHNTNACKDSGRNCAINATAPSLSLSPSHHMKSADEHTTSTARRFASDANKIASNAAQQRLSVPTFQSFGDLHNIEVPSGPRSVPYDPLTMSARMGAHRPINRRAHAHSLTSSGASINRPRRLSFQANSFAASSVFSALPVTHPNTSLNKSRRHPQHHSPSPLQSATGADEVEWISLCGKRPTLAEFLAEMERIRASSGFPAEFDSLFLEQNSMPDLVLDDGDYDAFGLRIRIPDLRDEFGTSVSTISNRVCFMVHRTSQRVVTYHACDDDPFEGFQKEWESGRHAHAGVARIAETMVRRVLRTFHKGVAALRADFDRLDSGDLSRALDDTERVQRLSLIAKKAAVYKRCADANAETALDLEGVDWMAAFVKSVCDMLSTVSSMSDEIAHNALASIDLIIALSEFKSNTNMKTFTYMTILLQPVTVATSWYGMNWSNMPELEFESAYFYFTGITWFVSFAVFAYFTVSRHFLENLTQQITGSLSDTRVQQLLSSSYRGVMGGGVNGGKEKCLQESPTEVSFAPSVGVGNALVGQPTETWRTLSRKLSVNPKMLKTMSANGNKEFIPGFIKQHDSDGVRAQLEGNSAPAAFSSKNGLAPFESFDVLSCSEGDKCFEVNVGDDAPNPLA